MLREKISSNWKQINFRTIESALGMEFLHELYNRYYPSVNSLRFHNVIIVSRGKTVTSYAPQEEWDFIAKWFGERFIKGDRDLYNSLKNYIQKSKVRLNKMIKRMKTIDFSKVDDIDLGLELIDLHFTTLTELYGLNHVQVEHALNYALDKMLKKYFKNDDERKNALVALSFATEPTIGVKEERSFLRIVRHAVKGGFTKLEKNTYPYRMLVTHYKKYRFVHCAYGAKPYPLSYYMDNFNSLLSNGEEYIESKISELDKSYVESLKQKKKYLKVVSRSNLLKRTIKLFEAIGTLRDQHKAKLGLTIEFRNKILDEIARRKSVNREDLDWYFLVEICNLLDHGRKLDKKIIKKRKKNMIIIRKEFLSYDEIDTRYLTSGSRKFNKRIKGTCASRGKHKGMVKIVTKSSDIKKFKNGDIMVALGTDFDLINIMQKAGAIITEEGGLLSHAAVISRELNIPCIINVKDATKTLKDGDIIEVDADKGFIKKVVER